MIRSLDELAPQSRAVAQDFLAAAAAAAPPGLRASVREDLTAHLCERLDPDTGPDGVRSLLAGLAADETAAGWSTRLRAAAAGLQWHGVFDRIAGTWWNPSDPRLLLPRAVGIGWDLNFGALAVRLGLIEPDAEAVPFTSTPATALRAAAGLPALLAGATALHYLVRGPRLPERLPDHWDLAGRADRWVTKRRAATTDLALAAAATGLAGWAAATDRPGPTRTGALAAGTLLGGLGVALATGRTSRGGAWLAPALLASALTPVGVLLVVLARAGRRAEVDRDLSEPPR